MRSGFSCYIWNIRSISSHFKRYSEVLPDVKILDGGSGGYITGRRLLERRADSYGVMVREGEATLAELAEGVWRSRRHRHSIGTGSRHRIRKPAARSCIPLCSRFFHGRNPIQLEQLRGNGAPDHLLRAAEAVLIPAVTACPSIDKTVRFRSLDLVMKELVISWSGKVPQVKFVDRTFNCKKSHALAIWRYLLEHDNGATNFHFEISADPDR